MVLRCRRGLPRDALLVLLCSQHQLDAADHQLRQAGGCRRRVCAGDRTSAYQAGTTWISLNPVAVGHLSLNLGLNEHAGRMSSTRVLHFLPRPKINNGRVPYALEVSPPASIPHGARNWGLSRDVAFAEPSMNVKSRAFQESGSWVRTAIQPSMRDSTIGASKA